MLPKFKITSRGDGSFKSRLGHNRIKTRTELIPLTEIYVCETATSRGERILKNAVHSFLYKNVVFPAQAEYSYFFCRF